MANNYTEFSEVIPNLNNAECAWLQQQFQLIYVYDGQEYPDAELPHCFDREKADWHGCRGLRDYPDYDPTYIEEPEFQYEFSKDALDEDWGRHLWIYSDENGDIDQVCYFVQMFLKQFRPNDCWSLTFAATCSKPRVGEFSGGAVFVTADTVRWDNAEAFIEREKAAFIEKRLGKPTEFLDAGPTIVVNVSGGVVQDVFCSTPDANVLLVDWDAEASDSTSSGVIRVEVDDRSVPVQIMEYSAKPLATLLNTDAEKAIQAAVQLGILGKPIHPT